MIKEILFILALLNLIFVAVAVHKGKNDLALALGILEPILVYFYFMVE